MQYVGDSDHSGVIAEKAMRIPRVKPNVVKKTSYKGFDIKQFESCYYMENPCDRFSF